MSHLLYSVLLPLRSAQNKIHMYTVLAACLPRVAADVQCLPRVAQMCNVWRVLRRMCNVCHVLRRMCNAILRHVLLY